ncbi:relaxase/mobilization nuclease domain-containing protein [Leisingera sp. M527]|uniref:relaxase/mobilization nuclease domain-containing protein n=1 Tax=Leisingera sp. M527 TaxID=2867014 RepID=UPI0021A2EFD7|nr:relaxase/mobilization nuclease domain-containing protein [Leisingera sp. M527]UWQ32078.1 relaxase/mobilization nuclease domain-containing protein [Leisingera sp. M527]
MLIKFFSNGKGGGAGPVEYLTACTVLAYDGHRDLIRDASGQPVTVTRAPLPEVVRGDPHCMIDLIDACPHQWTYRAGVVSFAREDAPTEDQQQEVIDCFEEIAFAGLDVDRYACLWVRHTHEDRVELHFCTPRMELYGGRSLNIAPPGYERAFDSLRDLMNKTHGWADPMDVERAAEVKPVFEAPDRAAGRDGLHAWIGDQISLGLIEDRAGLIAALNDAGFEVPRAGKNYLTVKDPETEERFRLKGEIFHEDWRAEATAERKTERGPGAHQVGERRLGRRTAAELQERFEDHCRKRAGYNQDRYGRLPAAREEAPHETERERSATGMEGADVADAGGLLPDDQHRGFDLDGDDLADAQSEHVRAQGDRATGGDVSDPAQRPGDADPLFAGRGARGLPDDPEGVSDGRSDATRTRIAELRRAVGGSLQGIRTGIDRLRTGQADGTGWVARLNDRFAEIAALIGRSLERLDAGIRAAQREYGTRAEGEEAPRDALTEDMEDNHALRH